MKAKEFYTRICQILSDSEEDKFIVIEDVLELLLDLKAWLSIIVKG